MYHWRIMHFAKLLEKNTRQSLDKCPHKHRYAKLLQSLVALTKPHLVHYVTLLCPSSVFEFSALCCKPYDPVSSYSLMDIFFSIYYWNTFCFFVTSSKLADWYFAAASALIIRNCLANFLRLTDSIPFWNAAVTQSVISTLQPSSACFFCLLFPILYVSLNILFLSFFTITFYSFVHVCNSFVGCLYEWWVTKLQHALLRY